MTFKQTVDQIDPLCWHDLRHMGCLDDGSMPAPVLGAAEAQREVIPFLDTAATSASRRCEESFGYLLQQCCQAVIVSAPLKLLICTGALNSFLVAVMPSIRLYAQFWLWSFPYRAFQTGFRSLWDKEMK